MQVDLLDHASGTLRLAASQALLDREEGRAVQAISISQPNEDERRDREAVNALFEHVQRTNPERFGEVAQWVRDTVGGLLSAPPAGLVLPADPKALDLWERLVAASGVVLEALL